MQRDEITNPRGLIKKGNPSRKETYIVYLERNKHEVHMPAKSFVVGSGKNSAEIAEYPEPSTPFLLLRALADGGQDGGEG